MTLEALQEQMARLYMAAGEKSQAAAEHAKAGRWPQAYRCECAALQDAQAAQALWPAILGAVVANTERKVGDEERARRCAQELAP